jgi:hypothetical protein
VNKTEVAKLLTIVSGFDRRQVDEMTVEAWHSIPEIADAPYEVGQTAVMAHFRDPLTRNEYLTVGRVLDRIEVDARSKLADIEADVRSAKARGLLEPTYPPREPLPADVKVLLFQARERDRETARLMYEVES